MADKNLGKYIKPGIYINEIDNSIIELPIQDIIINLVPGFSKKGPFNRPVYVDNTTDFKKIFGDIDPQLENKGSFFHRTCLKMIATSPIWCLNLLKTDATRDKLEWKSISLSPSYVNGALNSSSYEKFFNRQDFWERDPEAFLDNVVNFTTTDTGRMLHITNMGDKTFTVFTFKSPITGFDVTAENWYGGVTNIPYAFIDPKDYISDYMITVLLLNGDWSNYDQLSADSFWSKYFTTDGLIKTQISNFVNEKNVTILANYDVCLIPNFKDSNNRDLYIKNVINNDTDKTGLFIAYNEDLILSSDYPQGKIDLTGYSIVNKDVESIEFLSYKETITENLTFTQKYLDSSLNTFSTNVVTSTIANRSNTFTNRSTYGITFDNLTDYSLSFLADPNSFYVIGGVKYDYSDASSFLTLANVALNTQRVDHIYLSSGSSISVLNGNTTTIGGALSKYTLSLDDTIQLGYVVVVNSGGTISSTYYPITVDNNGYIKYITNGTGTYNISVVSGITTSSQQYIDISFNNTLGVSDLSNFNQMRYRKAFDELANAVQVGKAVIIETNVGKVKHQINSNYQITDYSTNTDGVIRLFVQIANSFTNLATYGLTIYYTDDEFLIGEGCNTLSTINTTYVSGAIGVVSEYSTFYQDFYNGNINILDYFITNNKTAADVTSGSETKVYIRPFIDTVGNLTVNFVGSTEETAGAINITNYSNVNGYNSKLIIYSDRVNWKQTVEVELPLTKTDLTKITEFRVDKNRYSEIVKGSFIEAYVDETDVNVLSGSKVPRRYARVIKTAIDSLNSSFKMITTDLPIKISDGDLSNNTDYITTLYPSIDKYVNSYKGVSIAPFTVHPDSIPNGSETRQSDILSVIGVGALTKIAKALANKNKIQWRYLIDSFGLGLIANSKQEFVDLCGKKLNCLGFLNMPSAKMFRNSNNPVFVTDGAIDYELVKLGGDESKNPSFLYSMGQGVGVSTVGYFYPYVSDTANGITKNVPPAMFVATAFMQKHISGVSGVHPWTVVAGVNDGKLVIGKPETGFNDDDLEQLELMSVNPIVNKLNNGYCLDSNNTAQVTPQSSLSSLHVRELLIEIENELYDMLLRYQWKFNTAQVRSEIKFRADKICKKYLDADALYDFRNICDETNNTPDVISQRKGVLDTYIEPVQAMGIIINNMTIEGVGKIASSGFGA